MNPTEREQLRLSLLRFLETAGGMYGLPSGRLLQEARAEGMPSLDKPSVERELEYLAEKGLVAEATKKLSPENRAWKLTADGRDFLAQHQA